MNETANTDQRSANPDVQHGRDLFWDNEPRNACANATQREAYDLEEAWFDSLPRKAWQSGGPEDWILDTNRGEANS